MKSSFSQLSPRIAAAVVIAAMAWGGASVALAQPKVPVKTKAKDAPAEPAPKPAEVVLLETEARGFQSRGDALNALTRWQEVYAKTSQADVLLRIAECYVLLDELEVADSYLDTALSTSQLSEADKAHAEQLRSGLRERLARYAEVERLLREGQPEEALKAALAAFEAQPSPRALGGVASGQERLGDLEAALASWRRQVTDFPLDPKAQAATQARIDDLQRRLQERNAAQVASAELEPDPGEGRPAEPTFEGDVRLIPLPEGPPVDEGWTPTKVLGFSLVGLGVAGVGVGIGLNVHTQGLIDDYSDALAQELPPEQLRDKADELSTFQDTVIVTYISGFLTAGVGAVLLYIAYANPAPPPEPKAEDKTSGLRFDVGPNGVLISAPWDF